jgi:hypothetical protein
MPAVRRIMAEAGERSLPLRDRSHAFAERRAARVTHRRRAVHGQLQRVARHLSREPLSGALRLAVTDIGLHLVLTTAGCGCLTRALGNRLICIFETCLIWACGNCLVRNYGNQRIGPFDIAYKLVGDNPAGGDFAGGRLAGWRFIHLLLFLAATPAQHHRE